MDRKTILLVESDPPRRLCRCHALSRDYDVVSLTDGGAAMKFLAKCIPDLLILDADASTVNGFDICRQVKLQDAFRGVGVLLMTGDKSTATQLYGALANADAILCQEASEDKLREVAAELFNRERFLGILQSTRPHKSGLSVQTLPNTL